MGRLGLVLMLMVSTGCSLLVDFDPENQPCDSVGACLPGYTCIDEKCHTSDGGIVDGGSQ